MTDLQKQLFAMQDVSYKEFHQKLMPTVDPDKVIGIRTPMLRGFAKEFAKTEQVSVFLKSLPHTYYEENNLHGFVVEKMKDFETCIKAVDEFLPYVDNWATCDLMSPKVFKKHLPELFSYIEKWIASKETYTVRFGIGMLMSFYLDEAFEMRYADMVANVQSEEYYVNMMRAWYFATALAKQYDAVLPYITEKRLDVWTHNKSIQKAVESYRITPEQKDYLKSFRIRKGTETV